MQYESAKVYFDGSHYIAIPHTNNPSVRRRRVKQDAAVPYTAPETQPNELVIAGTNVKETYVEEEPCPKKGNCEEKKERVITKRELFNELYEKNLKLKKKERKKKLIELMSPYFQNEEETKEYIERNLRRKRRNLIVRRTRLSRKVNLNDFNYFATFTYDDKKHTEATFKKKLIMTLCNFRRRKGWKYVGVWERSPEKNRLHFHALVSIPKGALPEPLIEVNDYSFKTHRRQITKQSPYFNERFGRSDFEEVIDWTKKAECMAYITKYIEKTGEKLVYSKGLAEYLKIDVQKRDEICRTGAEGKKIILFDDFECWSEGKYYGRASKEVFEKLPKIN